MSTGKKATANFRLWVFEKWAWSVSDGAPLTFCQECGRILSMDTLSLDHYPIPACIGGRYHKNNVRPLCAECNHSDGVQIGRMDRDELVALTRLRMVSPQYLSKMMDFGLRPVTLSDLDKEHRTRGLDAKIELQINGVRRKYP